MSDSFGALSQPSVDVKFLLLVGSVAQLYVFLCCRLPQLIFQILALLDCVCATADGRSPVSIDFDQRSARG